MRKDLSAPIDEGKLNEVRTIVTPRGKNRIRVQQDFSFCPTMAEQHTAQLTDVNYLIAKYKPDELAAYIAAKAAHRQEIVGHDFSQEPNLQDARNVTYQLKQSYNALPEDVKMHFKNHVEFLKFIDNPNNQEKMLKLGLMTEKEISQNTSTTTTTTQEEAKASESPAKSSKKPLDEK